MLHVGLSLETVQTLQRVLNTAAPLMPMGPSRYHCVTPVLWKLHQLPLLFCAQVRTRVFKGQLCLIPSDLDTTFHYSGSPVFHHTRNLGRWAPGGGGLSH